MSRKSVSIEVEINEWDAHKIIVNELLWERSILKKRGNTMRNKKEALAAIETVLDYFSGDWRETLQK